MLSEADFTGPSIGSHIDILSGFAFSSGGFHETEGLPLIRIRDLGKSGTEVRFCGRYDDQFIVRNGDTLIGMDGDFVAVRWNGGHALLNQRVCKVSAKPGGAVDTGYLFHLLQPQLDEIHRRTPQTTVRHLSANTLKDIRPFLPPLLEQRRIAEILDTLDEAIRKTEQVIAKLQQMKQGLLHDLLTRGIDDNGELRDPDRHPKQFKDSPLGRIPRDWEVAPLGAALESAIDGRFGSGLKTSHYVSSGVRVVRLQNIGAGYFDETDKAFISERYARSLVRH